MIHKSEFIRKIGKSFKAKDLGRNVFSVCKKFSKGISFGRRFSIHPVLKKYSSAAMPVECDNEILCYLGILTKNDIDTSFVLLWLETLSILIKLSYRSESLLRQFSKKFELTKRENDIMSLIIAMQILQVI